MKALIVIDYINEIVDEKGKLADKGYVNFIKEHNTFKHVNDCINKFRNSGDLIIFVKLSFDKNYENQPKGSPLFGKANEFGILAENTWSTEISDSIWKIENDIVLTKIRVSAFYKTGLTQILKDRNINEVYISAVATDLAGEAAARSAHDDDFKVFVVSDACAAANESDHQRSLDFLKKIATVLTVAEI